jgi:hypothetical protein
MSTKKLKQKRNTSVVLSKTNNLGNQRKSYLRHDSHIITSTNSLRTSSLNNQTSSSSSSSSLNNRKEYESFLRRYKIAMDQLTVDKLINHNITSMTLKMTLAKHSRTSLTPVVGEVLKAVISRSSNELTALEEFSSRTKDIVRFYADTDFTRFRMNSYDFFKSIKDKKSERKNGNKNDEDDELEKIARSTNLTWYSSTDKYGNYMYRWHSPLKKMVYCGSDGWLSPPTVLKEVRVKNSRGNTKFDKEGNPVVKMQPTKLSIQNWLRQKGQFSVRDFGSLGSGIMELKSPTGVATTTVGLPKHAIACIAISDSGNNRVQVWTLWDIANESSTAITSKSVENMTFGGLVGADSLFQKKWTRDSKDSNEHMENEMSDASDTNVNVMIKTTPDMIIERHEKNIERETLENLSTKLPVTYGSRPGFFMNPRGVTFGSFGADATRIFVTDNEVNDRQGSPRVQIFELKRTSKSKLVGIIDNLSVADVTASNSMIAPVHGVRQLNPNKFIYLDSNGLPILEEQSERILVSVDLDALDGYNTLVNQLNPGQPMPKNNRVNGFCWSFPRHIREYSLETFMLSCLHKDHDVSARVRKWFDIFNREPKEIYSKCYKSRKARVKNIESEMNVQEFAAAVKPHFAMHYFQHELLEHITGTTIEPTEKDMKDLVDVIEELASNGWSSFHHDESLVLQLVFVVIGLAQSLAYENDDIFEDEESSFEEKEQTDFDSMRGSSKYSRSHVFNVSKSLRKVGKTPPTHHNLLPPKQIVLKRLRLEALSKFLNNGSEMATLFAEIKRLFPQSEMDQQFKNLEEYRETIMIAELKSACRRNLQLLVAEMMFALLTHHIKVYDQLEDSYIFEPNTLPGKTYTVPRSAIRGNHMQAYFSPTPNEFGLWLEGVVVGVDRETGMYIFEHEKVHAHDPEFSIEMLLLPRSKLRSTVPKCKNIFTCPWSTCQAKSNGHGHLFSSDFENDCVHVFNGDQGKIAEEEEEDAISTNTGEQKEKKEKPPKPTFRKTRKYLYTIGKLGSLRGEFCGPKGICFDHANRLIVADSKNNRIQGFEYLMEAGGRYTDPLHPGIAPNHHKGGRWICTFIYPEEDHSNTNGIGTPGTLKCAKKVAEDTKGMPSLHRPSDVVVDRFENILVADTGNSCIRVLRRKIYYGPNEPVEPSTVSRDDLWMYRKTLIGKLVRVWPYIYMECIATWGCRGFGPGMFLSPVSIDHFTVTKKRIGKNNRKISWKEERYLVVDQDNHKITQFTLVPPMMQSKDEVQQQQKEIEAGKGYIKKNRRGNDRGRCNIQ